LPGEMATIIWYDLGKKSKLGVVMKRTVVYPPYRLFLFLLSAVLFSCGEEDPEQLIDYPSLLMSKGWGLEKYIFYFSDSRPEEEDDSLVLSFFRTDLENDTKVIYTGRWIVFDNDSLARTAFNYDLYTMPKGESGWTLVETNITGEACTGWGLDDDGQPYLNIDGPRPILVEVVNDTCFILRDDYLIESTELLDDEGATITSLFGDYGSGVLTSIDAVYSSSGKGPNWFPPWRYWP
jgi:hypothetical protein